MMRPVERRGKRGMKCFRGVVQSALSNAIKKIGVSCGKNYSSFSNWFVAFSS